MMALFSSSDPPCRKHTTLKGTGAVAIALGWHYRVAIVLFTLGFTYTQLVDVTNYLNHHYLVVLLGALLACLPANAAWSLDARRDPTLARSDVPAWIVWLLRFQVGIVYVFAGGPSGPSAAPIQTLVNPDDQSNAHFGSALALGDCTGDGIAEAARGFHGQPEQAEAADVLLPPDAQAEPRLGHGGDRAADDGQRLAVGHPGTRVADIVSRQGEAGEPGSLVDAAFLRVLHEAAQDIGR